MLIPTYPACLSVCLSLPASPHLSVCPQASCPVHLSIHPYSFISGRPSRRTHLRASPLPTSVRLSGRERLRAEEALAGEQQRVGALQQERVQLQRRGEGLEDARDEAARAAEAARQQLERRWGHGGEDGWTLLPPRGAG